MMGLKCRPWGISLAVIAASLCLDSGDARAAKFEKSIGVGSSFYSGDDTKVLTPSAAPHLSFSANSIFSQRWNLVNRFDLSYLSGNSFAGAYGAYSGYVGSYELALRLNFAKEVVFPYLEAGALLGMYAMTVGSSGNKDLSTNQTAMKYGYAVGIGGDFVKMGKRGDGNGWGFGLTYFNFMKSPSQFEFPSAKLGASGIAVEVRYLMAPKL